MECSEKRGVICNRPRKEISKKTVLNYIETKLSATVTAKVLKVALSCLCGYHNKNQHGIEFKIILSIENSEEPR